MGVGEATGSVAGEAPAAETHSLLRLRALPEGAGSSGGSRVVARWNYARYFVIPMLAGYQEGVSYVPSVKESLEAIRAWENMIRVWEGDEGKGVGAVTIEYPLDGLHGEP